jgi:hypothetical protein
MSESTTSPEQLKFSIDHEEAVRLSRIQQSLGRAGAELALGELRAGLETESFSFREFAGFVVEHGQPVQVAGKSFKRFYEGLDNLGALPAVAASDNERVLARRQHRRYVKSREELGFRLGLLSAVLARPDLAPDDHYTKLLENYERYRLGQLLVKQSTSE